MDSDEQNEPMLGLKPAKNRDFAILMIIAVLVIAAFIALTFKLIDQEDTHVRNVEKVKMAEDFSYDEIGSDDAEKTVTAFVNRTGRRTQADFSTLNLTDDLLKKLSTVKELERLDVGHTKITDKSVDYIVGLPLQQLDLSASPIGDEAMKKIAKIKTLQKLTITQTAVTDVGIAEVLNLPLLENLTAGNTKITDRGIAQLSKSRSINRLDLTSTPITDACLKDLSKLPLKVIYVDATKITGPGITKSLRLPSLIKASFSRLAIHDQDLPGLLNAIPKVCAIDLSVTPLTDKGVATLATWDQLGVLKLKYMEHVSDKAIKDFKAKRPRVKFDTSK
ncbi:MAG: hypothetical protein SGJ27_16550 [Candidatus Melainabacteria bacterium]|nr:hypothetical protein [Candidatus Melainabacteria bacterium]